MTAHPSILLRVVLACVCLASLAPSQGRKEGGMSDEQAIRLAKAKAAMAEGGAEKADAGDGERGDRGEWANLTPEERLARNVVNGASAYCRFVASCRPAKLLPGQSGTLFVTALLQGNAVLPSPAPIELLPRTQTTPVAVGALAVEPAELGTFAKAYLGQPVYDNFAVFQVPVTMGSQAKIGEKHGVALDLKFDLYDGNSAQPVGRFIDRVATEIEVGVAPDPVVQGGAKKPAAVPEEPVAPAAAAARGAEAVRAPQPAAAPGEDVAPPTEATEPAPRATSPQPPPTSDSGEGLPLPLLLGGGVLVLVILLLLLRKRG